MEGVGEGGGSGSGPRGSGTEFEGSMGLTSRVVEETTEEKGFPERLSTLVTRNCFGSPQIEVGGLGGSGHQRVRGRSAWVPPTPTGTIECGSPFTVSWSRYVTE